MNLNREDVLDENGYRHLRLSGADGGVSLVVMPTGVPGINPVGVLTVHYLPGRLYLGGCDGTEGARPQECPDFGGTCFPSNAFPAGQEAANYVTRGAENHVWGVLEDWYVSRLTPSVEAEL